MDGSAPPLATAVLPKSEAFWALVIARATTPAQLAALIRTVLRRYGVNESIIALLLPRLLVMARQSRHDSRGTTHIRQQVPLLNRSLTAREHHDTAEDISNWYSLLSFIVALVGLDFTTILVHAGFTSVIDNQDTTTACTENGRWPLVPLSDSGQYADDVAPS